MKNHWLDKKVDREIDAALAEIETSKSEFKDSDFIDLSGVTQHNDRYKEYERLDLNLEITKEIDKEIVGSLKAYDILTSTDKEDREMVKAILLKNFHKTHWLEEIMTEVQYAPHLAPGCDPKIAEYAYRLGDDDLGNLTINCCGNFPENTVSGTFVMPGGDGITLNDNITISAGFPQDDANSLQQWSAGDANLEIWYGTPFIQDEKLQVLNDLHTDVTQYQTMHTPVLAGTMTGTIYPTPGNTSYGFTFVVSSAGKFTFDQFVQENGKVEYASKQPKLSDEECLQALANGEYDERFFGWYDHPYVEGTTLNLQTGVLELHYHMGRQPEIIVSYEYNLDLEVGK